MNQSFELFRIGIALLCNKILPSRLHTRLSRWLYNFNSTRNKGIDLVIDYQPVSGITPVKLYLNTKEFIGWNIFFLGNYELVTDLILTKFVKDGMYAIEAGAHIGSETVLLGALVGEAGKVYAFEPNPAMLKRLRLNIALNDFADRVVASGIALGEKNGNISFFVDNENEPNQGRASKYNYDPRTIEINARQQKLDDWVRENRVPRIDFIKMDVQGAEIDILQGAAETIARYNPVIYTEASATMQKNSQHSMEDMYRTLVSFDYSVHRVNSDGTLHLLSETSLAEGNWLATPRQ